MKVFERHRKELQPFTRVVKLTTPSASDGRGGGMQETIIFDTDAQLRITLLANTPRGQRVRENIINMLKAIERQEFIHISQVRAWQEKLIELDVRDAINRSNKLDWQSYQMLKRYRAMGLTQRETAKLLDVTRETVQKFERIPRQYSLAILDGGSTCPIKQ